MSWWNPLSWIPEDPVTRCGWYALSLYDDPKADPYYDFCAWDDAATTSGSFESKIVTLERHIEAGLDQITLIQSRYPPGSFEWELGEFYKKAWPHLVGLFQTFKE